MASSYVTIATAAPLDVSEPNETPPLGDTLPTSDPAELLTQERAGQAAAEVRIAALKDDVRLLRTLIALAPNPTDVPDVDTGDEASLASALPSAAARPRYPRPYDKWPSAH